MKHAKKMNTILLTIAAGLLLTVAGASAQQQGEQPQQPQQTPPQLPGQQAPEVKEDFSDQTLEKFVDINKKLAPHQQQGEAKMIKAIEDQGMKAERFGEIMTARQMNDSTNAGATEEELQKVEAAAQDIMGIQQELQQKMTKVIMDEGMEIQEFQDIILAYQYSPKIQQKVNDLLEVEQNNTAPADSGQTAPVEE